MFQTIIVRPLYNLLLVIYGYLPGHDLGVSLILFTLVIRLALWPLLKKQLHQTRVMRDLQPELTKIKKAAAGNKQKEGQLMMAMYKEKGISPFGAIGLTILQLPLLIGVLEAARSLTEHVGRINTVSYSFVRKIPHIHAVITNKVAFNFKSFGFVDLSQKAIVGGKIYLPIVVLAAAATVFQYFQSKQLIPQPKEKKKLRDILRASAVDGKQPAQEDMTAAMSSSMLFLMPIITILFALAAQGALVVYLLAGSVIGIIQQTIIFRRDTDEMEAEVVSVKKTPTSKKKVVSDEPAAHVAVAVPTAAAEKINKGKVVTKTRIIGPGASSSATKQHPKKRKKR